MLTVLPLPQGEEKESFLRETPGAEGDAEVLAFCDGEKRLGLLAVDLPCAAVRLLNIKISNEAEPPQVQQYAESLIRAAAVYGMNLGAYRLESLLTGWDAFLTARGFRQNGEKTTCLLSQIVRKCSD